jgi:phospholipase C
MLFVVTKSAPGQFFDRVFIIVFENTGFEKTMSVPEFSNLSTKGKLCTNYFGLIHPSQPNYIHMIAGTNYNVVDNGVYDLDARSVIDLLEANQLSWKFYQELYPGSCFLGACFGGSNGCKYARKHNPIISFLSTQNNSARCDRVVGGEVDLDADLQAGTLPDYR